MTDAGWFTILALGFFFLIGWIAWLNSRD